MERFKVWRVERINKKKHSRCATSLVLDAAILHRVFSFALESEMVVKNPVRMEGRPGENPTNGAEPFTAAHLSKMREHAGPDLLAFLLLRWTALRGVDAVTLTWSEVHLGRKEIERVTQKRKKRVSAHALGTAVCSGSRMRKVEAGTVSTSSAQSNYGQANDSAEALFTDPGSWKACWCCWCAPTQIP